MQEYISDNIKALKKSTRICAIIAGIGLIVLAFYLRSIYTGIVGLLLLGAALQGKTIKVTEEGVVMEYDLFFIKHRDVWPFEEISDIHTEPSPDGKKMALHVMRDIMSKRLVFMPIVAKRVIELALEKNPAIHVGEMNK